MNPPTLPDDYERRYMRSDDAIARERIHMAWWGHAILALALAHSIYAGHLLGVVLVPLVWLVFMTLRVTITPAYAHVQLGVFGPKIPIDRIERAEVAKGSFLRAGWGIRFGLDGKVTYSVPGPARDYLLVAYRRGKKQKTVRVMSRDPERLVRAIEQARGAPGARARVAALPEAEPAALDEETESAARERARGR